MHTRPLPWYQNVQVDLGVQVILGGPLKKMTVTKKTLQVLLESWCLKLLEVLTMSGMLRMSCGENKRVHYTF